MLTIMLVDSSLCAAPGMTGENPGRHIWELADAFAKLTPVGFGS